MPHELATSKIVQPMVVFSILAVKVTDFLGRRAGIVEYELAAGATGQEGILMDSLSSAARAF
jgi:hypothetical protein